MNECDLCYEPTRNRKRNERGELWCTDCRELIGYYESMTPEQRAEEERMIADYFAEHGDDL